MHPVTIEPRSTSRLRDARFDGGPVPAHKYGYPGRVKTTIEIDDELLRRAKVRAAERGETLKALLERCLRRELNEIETHRSGYVLRDASVGDPGDRIPVLNWDEIREEDTNWRVWGS